MKSSFALCFLLLASCQSPKTPRLKLVQRSQPLLGAFVTISVYGENRGQAQNAISQAFDEFRRIDKLMSIHRADSELMFANEIAALVPVTISEDLFRVLAFAQEVAGQTEGSFDVTIRPLVQLWGFLWKEYRLPTDEELKATLPNVDYKLVQLDKEKSTLHFRKAGISIDLGGIAKGYAVDCAIEKLRSLGIKNAMVKAGGDLRVIGHPPGKSHWLVQLEDPEKKGKRRQIPLRDAAVSTAGNYENFFVLGSKHYAHILDPRTGFPVENLAACTVIAPTCMESDALSTAFFVFGKDKSLAKFGDRWGIQFTFRPENSDEPGAIFASPSFPSSQ